MIKKIKEMLLEDTSKIETLLEELECGEIVSRSNEIRCALPDSCNNTSVQIFLSEHLNVNVWSRQDFDDYEVKDIFTLVQFIKGFHFKRSVEWVCKTLGIEYEGDTVKYKKSPVIKTLKKFKPKEQKIVEHKVLDESYLDKYEKYVVDDWVAEGISEEVQNEFGVFIDRNYSRWKIPIRDEFGRLITTKGRTYVEDYQLKGIYKYIFYPPLGVNDIIFGLDKTLKYAKEKNELILFEAEKSVMKAYGMGYKNCASVGKNSINLHIVKKLIGLDISNIVLCFDKDVAYDEVMKEANKLKFFKNVYYVIDKGGLLEKKDSPVDKGVDIWEELYQSKKML